MFRIGLRPKRWTAAIALGAMVGSQLTMPLAYAQQNQNDAQFRQRVKIPPYSAGFQPEPAPNAAETQPGIAQSATTATTTPIKHVIMIIGENRTFDHVFATYQPNAGQTVHNLLSEGIVKLDGTPGPNVALAQQWRATDTVAFSNSPDKTSAYQSLPDMNTDGAPQEAPFSTAPQAESVEPGLPLWAYDLLTIGGTGLPGHTVDIRFPSALANAPFPIDNYITYDDYAASPVHRFFQMWQQLDCNNATSSRSNPSGCTADLFPWVETTVGAGTNGLPRPNPFDDQTTGEGSTSMQFFNVAQGDAYIFNQLAHQYALSDNMHQSIMGGTGANHIMLGYGSLIYYADSAGNPAVPPNGNIENPNPQPGTNNWYVEDGYGFGPIAGNGGSYVNCSSMSQPGVAPIMNYLNSLRYTPFNHGDCQAGAYYLVNNYDPGYLGNGSVSPQGANQFTMTPSLQPNIGTLMNKHSVSWKYYGEGWSGGTELAENASYCNICNPFSYSTQIMTSATQRATHLGDVTDLYNDINGGTLPSVTIVKPDGYLDGHPASSKLELFEAFCQKIISMVQANPALWASTAIMITFDEGGGFWDSGYVQTIDFFGDGTRIPLLVISPFSKGGRVVHTYYDHVSFAKFVEANWNLGETISPLGRDNLPNPTAGPNAYVPGNEPAIGDLMDMFVFPPSSTAKKVGAISVTTSALR
jgi:phospholipase C